MWFYNKNFKTYMNFPDTIMHANMKFKYLTSMKYRAHCQETYQKPREEGEKQ